MDALGECHDLQKRPRGIAVTYLGVEVEVFQCPVGAIVALQVARQALQQLDETLAKAAHKE